jgi:UDP-glucose 4-epimerase
LKGQYAPVIGLFLKQYYESKPLTVVGNGSQRRDFTHISDVIQANILASEVENGFGEVYNIGYGSNYSILDIANMISNDIKFIPPRIGEVQETLASNAKFKNLTGWTPKVSLTEWLKKLPK